MRLQEFRNYMGVNLLYGVRKIYTGPKDDRVQGEQLKWRGCVDKISTETTG